MVGFSIIGMFEGDNLPRWKRLDLFLCAAIMR